MIRLFSLIAALLVSGWSLPAAAEVTMSFHSFNGSVLFGRYPHTFVVLKGTMQGSGAAVDENYGFTAKKVSTAILSGPVEHDIMVEDQKYIKKTNRHFSVTLTDAQVERVRATMRAWRDQPGKYYDLDTRNCIHFVGAMAKIAGLKVDYPKKMLRRPKKWLNHIAALNPDLGAKRIR
ncbi:hypothetical protein HKD42_09840 [Altererythrobacter sp. RZ02]|uniref:DUF4105 domain-containing protein n=1 Tax=Pontixanthobacter rizhaonensis TaxID=2730337 RepID=A0A848QFF2_9SPHN|nr:hypothetical protein [Pontixanthobacter rizhaonensis]NMW32361.1 hypothetical protein [Pontixanthobacter rizhaonensis]